MAVTSSPGISHNTAALGMKAPVIKGFRPGAETKWLSKLLRTMAQQGLKLKYVRYPSRVLFGRGILRVLSRWMPQEFEKHKETLALMAEHGHLQAEGECECKFLRCVEAVDAETFERTGSSTSDSHTGTPAHQCDCISPESAECSQHPHSLLGALSSTESTAASLSATAASTVPGVGEVMAPAVGSVVPALPLSALKHRQALQQYRQLISF